MNSNLLEVFRAIYHGNHWGSPESVSGTGSTLEATGTLRTALPDAFHRLDVCSLLDVPCGDFGWFSRMPLEGITVTGMDIVPELVERCAARFAVAHPAVRFITGDLLSSALAGGRSAIRSQPMGASDLGRLRKPPVDRSQVHVNHDK